MVSGVNSVEINMGVVNLVETGRGDVSELETLSLRELERLGMDLIEELELRRDRVRLYQRRFKERRLGRSKVCGDARTYVTIELPEDEADEREFVDPQKVIASVIKRKEETLEDLTRYSFDETTSHRCSESVCGGEKAALSFYASIDGVTEPTEIEARVGQFKRDLVHHHGIPEVTAEWVGDNLLWARSEEAARKFWNERGGVSDQLMERIIANLDKFRDNCYVGLTAALNMVVEAEWVSEARLEGYSWRGMLTAGVVNHHDQISTPVGVIDMRSDEISAVFTNGLTEDTFLEDWPEESEMLYIPQDVIEEMGDGAVTRYYAQARKPIDHGEDFSSQGDFFVVVDDLRNMHPIVLADRLLLSPGKAFGVSLSGKPGLTEDDVEALAQAGYAKHLGVKGIVIFSQSLEDADEVLGELRRTWAKDLLKTKGFVVAIFNEVTLEYDHMVVGKDGDEPVVLAEKYRQRNG